MAVRECSELAENVSLNPYPPDPVAQITEFSSSNAVVDVALPVRMPWLFDD